MSKMKQNEHCLSIRVIKLIIAVVLVSFFVLATAKGIGFTANALEMSNPISSTVVPDGVYAFKNKASGFFIDIKRDSREPNAYIQQYNYGSVPTAVGNNTITHAAYNAGAKVAIGTTKTVGSSSANEWVEFFFSCMAIGFDVETSITEANIYIAEEYPAAYDPCECICVGDKSFTLP